MVCWITPVNRAGEEEREARRIIPNPRAARRIRGSTGWIPGSMTGNSGMSEEFLYNRGAHGAVCKSAVEFDRAIH